MYHITEQNAGLIIRRLESSYSFQTFELSPTNKAAMTTKGRLIREFPATVTEVSAKDFNNSSFQEVLTKTLVKMSHQAVAEMQPKVKKAQQMHNEERDTTDPRIVTELLTSFLRGAGTPGEIKAIHKRTREEVSWNNSITGPLQALYGVLDSPSS
jgi:cysteine synthase